MTTTTRKPGWWLKEKTLEERIEFGRKGGLAAKKNPNTHRWKIGEQATSDAGRKGGSVRGKNNSGHRATSTKSA